MDKKEAVKVLGEYFKVKPMYMGAPSFAYQIEAENEIYTIDRAGKIISSAGVEVEIESLLNGDKPEEPCKFSDNALSVEVAVPMEGHTGITLRNLVNMIYSKQVLIKKSLGLTDNIIETELCQGLNEGKIESLDSFRAALEIIGEKNSPGIAFDFNNNKVTFKFLKAEANPEKIQAYTQLVGLLNQNAKAHQHASAKSKNTDNDKFTFRVFLIRLGMVGDEYKVARKVLLENLEGNSAFRSGKKPEKNMVTDTVTE